MGGVSGDFGRLAGTIAALNRLSRVPSRVAAIAAPKLEEQAHADAFAGRDPYGRAFAPLAPATLRRWGKHRPLNLTGAGIASIRVRPRGGAGIEFTATEYMRFSQGGTVNEPVRATLPNRATLPKSWNAILKQAAAQAFGEVAKGVR